MEFTQRKNHRLDGCVYNQDGTYFITICTQDRKKILSRISEDSQVLSPELLPHGEIADKYIRQMDSFYGYLSVDKYVIMPDHIHFLITVHQGEGHPGRGVPTERTSIISRFVGTFKRYCNKEYGGNIWQSRYYDHVIRNQQDYNEIWEYIEYNPQKWIIQKRGYE